MFKKTTLGVCLSLIALNANANEQNHSHNHDLATSHAPIGVMGDHMHEEGELMFSYRYANMQMDGNRDGTTNLSSAETRAKGFMVAPIDMSMEMHMFGAMYGISDDLTLMAMVPYVRKSMNHETGTLVRFKTTTEGFGDSKISGMYNIFEQNQHKVHLNFGMSLPTGSTNERYDTPAGNNSLLPYPMQLGSGTYDPLLGVTYNNYGTAWAWGAQANAVVRVHDNNKDYRLGNKYGVTTWIARNLTENASVSFRLDAKSWNDIQGSDSRLNTGMVPTANPDLRGGQRVDAIIGANLLGGSGALEGHRLSAEFGMPVYENLDGPQLSTDYRFIIGWQKSL